MENSEENVEKSIIFLAVCHSDDISMIQMCDNNDATVRSDVDSRQGSDSLL
jgi:hypothetical protein